MRSLRDRRDSAWLQRTGQRSGKGRPTSRLSALPALSAFTGVRPLTGDSCEIISCLTVVLMDSAEDSQRTGVASRALAVFGLPNSPGN
jgi:hypothetical protein